MAASRMRVPKKNKMKWKRENIEGSWEDEVPAPTLHYSCTRPWKGRGEDFGLEGVCRDW
jgi:hypothetical protein